MRLRTLLLWLIVLGVLAWLGYTIVYVSSSYIEVGGLVDRSVNDAIQRRKAAVAAAVPDRDFATHVRSGVVTGAKRAGIVLEDDGVQITEGHEGVRITVQWSFPAITYGGQTVISIPISLTRIVNPGGS